MTQQARNEHNRVQALKLGLKVGKQRKYAVEEAVLDAHPEFFTKEETRKIKKRIAVREDKRKVKREGGEKYEQRLEYYKKNQKEWYRKRKEELGL